MAGAGHFNPEAAPLKRLFAETPELVHLLRRGAAKGRAFAPRPATTGGLRARLADLGGSGFRLGNTYGPLSERARKF